jgi:hypothetical protein
LTSALYCHCTRCQRRTGTGFSVSGLTVPGSFEIDAGAESVRTWTPPDGGWVKAFCAECGGQLYAASPKDPGWVAVRLGALDSDPAVRPSAHQFVAYAPAWSPVPDDGMPRFEERVPDAGADPEEAR